MIPSAAERDHMVDLIKEFREIMIALPKTTRQSGDKKKKVVSRLQEIRKEMLYYKSRYPDG